jgi:nucleoside-diphosphate-sugar epimerase
MAQNPPDYFKDLADFAGAEVLRGDLTDQKFLQNLPEADYIIHAAGYGQPGKFLQNPVKTLKVNTQATFTLLEKLLPEGKFVFISTGEVYSGSGKYPFKEEEMGTTTPSHDRGSYIESKRCGEAICNAYAKQGKQARSVRLSLAYGPGTKADDARVLNNFIAKAIRNGKIEMLDNGQAKRTYCYVTDAVKMILQVLFAGTERVYNVGGISDTNIAGLAKEIGRQIGVPVIFPKTDQSVNGAPTETKMDIGKYINEFHKGEFVSLEEGLKQTIAWQKILYQQ